MGKIVINGQLTTLNQYINAERRNRYIAGSIKKKETKRCADSALQYLEDNPDVKIEFPANIHIKWYRENKRSDPDNIAFAIKFIFDGLMEAGLLENDNWVNIKRIEHDFEIDKNNPRVEVYFKEG